MPDDKYKPENLPELIDYLIKTKDPAVVGLRRILKSKSDAGRDFPLKEMKLEEFADASMPATVFTAGEKRIMELEKEVLALRSTMDQQKKNAEQSIQEAHKRGLREGIASGEKNGHSKAKTDFDRQMKIIEEKLLNVLAGIERSRQNLLLEAQRMVLDLTMQIVRKVINTEISVNPEIVLAVIKKALTFISERQRFIVRVAPDDMETVTQRKDFWTSISDRLDKISIEADKRIEKGGCIVDSAGGIADARISVQISEMTGVIDQLWENMVSAGRAVTPDNRLSDMNTGIATQQDAGKPLPDTAAESKP